jgi:protein dithiol:quinone oxidoreductase
LNRRWVLAGTAATCVAAVAAALYTQHVWGMQPCPWCVLQRLIFIAIAAACLVGLALPRAGAALGAVLAVGGIAAAAWQHFVASSSESCDLSLADRIVGATGLDGRFPDLFMAMASCADARVTLAGLPYEAWSGGLFTLAALVLARVAWRR